MYLVDVHCHLDHERYKDILDELLERNKKKWCECNYCARK